MALDQIPTGLVPLAVQLVNEVLRALDKGKVPPKYREVFSKGTLSEMTRVAARLKAARELGIEIPDVGAPRRR